MNNISTQAALSRSPENLAKPEGRWDKTVAFLQRDIRSFFPSEEGKDETANLPDTAAAPDALGQSEHPIESLVDFGKLPDMAFRREVLDWRDNFHANVTNIITELQQAFFYQVDAELRDTSVFRKLITRPANEVLQDSFVRIVRMPLITALRKEEANLNACARKWALFGKADLAIHMRMLNSECASLYGIGFKPGNRSLIEARVQTLLLGPEGFAMHFCDQGSQLSRKLMEVKESC
ncbi:hypothetical protein LJR066_001673 [Acidovorax sp. LjRoot66]|uniref:hypothetical protein n=1 Tax=unclassified Acidovorax TaxID=2684926 RepID=UPI000AD36D49|nr:hypothetical protein [Acidovorax sp. Root219]